MGYYYVTNNNKEIPTFLKNKLMCTNECQSESHFLSNCTSFTTECLA